MQLAVRTHLVLSTVRRWAKGASVHRATALALDQALEELGILRVEEPPPAQRATA